MNKENIICNEEIYIPVNIQTNSKNDISDLIERKSLLKTKETKESIHSIVNVQPNENMNLKYLEKYKEVYIPKIYLMEYNDPKKYEYEPDNISSTQNFINFQNNPYFNYGYNIEQWKIYVDKIRSKFDELNELVKKGKIRLPEPNNEMEYLMALPSDFGGLGELYHEDKYENLKFYNPKEPENANKSFMKQIKFDRKETWFPLKPNPESFTKKITFYDFLNLKYNFFNLNNINMNLLNKNNNISSGNITSNEEKDKNNFNNIKLDDKLDEKNDENKKLNSKDDNEEEKEEEDYNLKTRERSRSRRSIDDYNDGYYDRRDREDRKRNRNRKIKYYNSSGYNREYSYRNNYKYYLSRDNNYYYDKYKNKKNYFKHSFKKYY